MINAVQLIARWTQSGLTPKKKKNKWRLHDYIHLCWLLGARCFTIERQNLRGRHHPRKPSLQERASVPPPIIPTTRSLWFHRVPTIPQITVGRGQRGGWEVWVVSVVFRRMAPGYCSIHSTDKRQKSISCQHPKYKVLFKYFWGFYDYYDHLKYASSPQRMCTFSFKEPIWPLQGFC